MEVTLKSTAFLLALGSFLLGCDGGKGVPGGGSPLDFTLKDLDGKPVSLSSQRGKPVLLNFWAVG